MEEQRITFHEYVQIIPPLPKYSSTLPGPKTNTPPFVRHPQLTFHWETFKDDVMEFIRKDIVPRTNRVQRPVFELRDVEIRSEVPMLQAFISQNLLNVVATLFDCTIITCEYGDTVGATDSYIKRGTKTIAICEYKGNWVLNPEWFQDGRIDQGNISNYIQSSINQLYTYMVQIIISTEY